MSRSYKKTPICKDHNSGKVGKRLANKKVRRYKGELANGKAYKKVFESWDIHDYVSRWTKAEVINRYEKEVREYEEGVAGRWRYSLRNKPNLEEEIRHWEKYYYRK